MTRRKKITRLDDLMSEEDWQAEVIGIAKRCGWRVMHSRPAPIPGDPSGRLITHVTGDQGWPDLALARDGVFLAVELKRNDRSPSPEQRRWLEHLGPFGHVWRPRDRDTVVRILTAPRPLRAV